MIETPVGTATAIALPGSEASLSPVDKLLKSLFVAMLQFVFDLVSPAGPGVTGGGHEETRDLEMSTPNAA